MSSFVLSEHDPPDVRKQGSRNRCHPPRFGRPWPARALPSRRCERKILTKTYVSPEPRHLRFLSSVVRIVNRRSDVKTSGVVLQCAPLFPGSPRLEPRLGCFSQCSAQLPASPSSQNTTARIAGGSHLSLQARVTSIGVVAVEFRFRLAEDNPQYRALTGLDDRCLSPGDPEVVRDLAVVHDAKDDRAGWTPGFERRNRNSIVTMPIEVTLACKLRCERRQSAPWCFDSTGMRQLSLPLREAAQMRPKRGDPGKRDTDCNISDALHVASAIDNAHHARQTRNGQTSRGSADAVAFP